MAPYLPPIKQWLDFRTTYDGETPQVSSKLMPSDHVVEEIRLLMLAYEALQPTKGTTGTEYPGNATVCPACGQHSDAEFRFMTLKAVLVEYFEIQEEMKRLYRQMVPVRWVE